MNNRKPVPYGLQYHEISKKYEKGLLKSNYNSVYEVHYKDYSNSKAITLEEVNKDCQLYNILNNRKSVRRFDNRELLFEKLSTLLSLSASINRRDENNMKLRMYPSAGGLFPLEIYIISFNSDKLSQGIYHYNILENSLELIRLGDFKEKIYSVTSYQDFILDSGCIICISAVFERSMKKYGERGYRYVLLDAGHLGQNIYLTSTYLGLGTVGIGGFLDNEYNKLIGLEHKDESIIYCFAVGNPAELDI